MKKKPPPAVETVEPSAPPGTGDSPTPPADKKKKATKAEMIQRTHEVLALILDGAQIHDLVQYGAGKGWDVGERQIRDYVALANDLLRERQELKRSRLLAYHRAARRSLFGRALQAADFRTALAVLQDEAKLVGLYPTDKAGDTKRTDVPLVIIRDTADAPPEPAEG